MTTHTRIWTGWTAICFLSICSALVLLAPRALLAQTVSLADDHPDVYVVEEGDTLWDIAGRFLQEPARWPEVWQGNPQVANPDLIYPGDRLRLEYVGGEPRIVLDRGGEARRTVRLSPEVRSTPREEAIPAIPRAVLDNFLVDNLIVDLADYENAPYIVSAAEENLIIGAGDQFYARGDWPETSGNWDIFRMGLPWSDADGELLGHEALRLGSARVVAHEGGQMRRLQVRRSREELKAGDRLMLAPTEALDLYFFPRPPQVEVRGRVLSLLAEDSVSAQYDSLLMDIGQSDGLRMGDLLRVYLADRQVADPVTGEVVSLPRQQAAQVLVYRVFDGLSYGIILSSTRPVEIGYELHGP